MADKKDKKDSGGSKLTFEAVEIIIIIIFILGIGNILMNWANTNHFSLSAFVSPFIFSFINFYARYVIFSLFLCIALFVLLIIYIIKEQEIKQKIMSKVLPPKGGIIKESKNVAMLNPKWKVVEDHINSDDASKWKLAILEADIILSDLLDSLQLPGEGVGEKLKNVEASDFDHLEQAWEAHKIRNAIAHEGSDFLLTQREAKRVVDLYRSVFEEFEMI